MKMYKIFISFVILTSFGSISALYAAELGTGGGDSAITPPSPVEKQIPVQLNTVKTNESISGTTEQNNQIQKATEPARGDSNNRTEGKNSTVGLWLISIFNSICLFLLFVTRKGQKK